MKLEVVEITSIEIVQPGDCVILDLIIPVTQTPVYERTQTAINTYEILIHMLNVDKESNSK